MNDFINDIKENYLKMERELVTQLNYNVGNHSPTAGSNREEIWADFFRRIVPKKFNIARSVFIIDSKRNVSKEVDIAIYDDQYTPYIFNYGLIKFIPVEAVTAVVQCKSKRLSSKILKEWTEYINKLETSKDSIARLATNVHIGDRKKDSKKVNEDQESKLIQIATTPIKILCYLSKSKKVNRKHEGRDSFDIIIEAYQNKNIYNQDSRDLGNLNIVFKKNKNLYDILCQYNRNNKDYEKGSDTEKELRERKISDYVVHKKENEYTLLSFIFQFNQMLMMINNPMFFPHKAYVDMFNKDMEGE